MSDNSGIVESLEGLWGSNKAKGLVAQGVFFEELKKGTFGTDASDKGLGFGDKTLPPNTHPKTNLDDDGSCGGKNSYCQG